MGGHPLYESGLDRNLAIETRRVSEDMLRIPRLRVGLP